MAHTWILGVCVLNFFVCRRPPGQESDPEEVPDDIDDLPLSGFEATQRDTQSIPNNRKGVQSSGSKIRPKSFSPPPAPNPPGTGRIGKKTLRTQTRPAPKTTVVEEVPPPPSKRRVVQAEREEAEEGAEAMAVEEEPEIQITGVKLGHGRRESVASMDDVMLEVDFDRDEPETIEPDVFAEGDEERYAMLSRR